MKFTIFAFGIIVLICTLRSSTAKSSTLDNEASTHSDKTAVSVNDIRKRAYRSARGAVYIRWGHHGCPDSRTQLVYSGYAGGSHYTHQGAATNYLCLTKDVTTSTDQTPFSWFGYLYGAEYQFSMKHHTFDVPCAVCQSFFRNSFMLPGADKCPVGWRVEYKGLLMAGYYNHAAGSEYVCVDSAKEVVNKSHDNKDGKLFYPVRAQCGSLGCPPYAMNQLVTCAVCSR